MIEKKPIKLILYFFISIFTFSSCSRYVGTKDSDMNLKIPVGTFSNYSVDTGNASTNLWKRINPKDSLPYYFNKSALIRIEKSGKKYVVISLLVDGKEIKRTQRKFKYRAGKFFLKKDSYFEVEHVVFFRFGGEQFFLKLNENNNLILRTESSGMAFFIIVPIGGYGGDDKETEFKKVESGL